MLPQCWVVIMLSNNCAHLTLCSHLTELNWLIKFLTELAYSNVIVFNWLLKFSYELACSHLTVLNWLIKLSTELVCSHSPLHAHTLTCSHGPMVTSFHVTWPHAHMFSYLHVMCLIDLLSFLLSLHALILTCSHYLIITSSNALI